MKLFEFSPETYEMIEVLPILEYLQANKNIGNEEIKDEPTLFHCYWVGPFLPSHLLCIKSLLDTQNVDKVYIWVPKLMDSFSTSHIFRKLKNVEIKEFNKEIFDKITNVSNLYKEKLYSKYMSLVSLSLWQNPEKQYAYASDLFRFVILNVYGGVYFDMDNLFLRNVNDIKIQRWISQWGSYLLGNACIMRLEKDHDLIEPIMKSIPQYFYPTETFKMENPFDITMLHGAFFDTLWRDPRGRIPKPENSIFIPFKTCDDFFKKTNVKIDKDILFKGAFTFHWHNRWKVIPEENSPYSQLLSQY